MSDESDPLDVLPGDLQRDLRADYALALGMKKIPDEVRQSWLAALRRAIRCERAHPTGYLAPAGEAPHPA